ncbi:thioredoxin [Prevotella brunnea]|uniref:thioredoxin n=1 Tax=Prevotella brunnea TaxID=2508867 RepID=UPI0028313AA6|nr:thioredoxin [Prevotella brunnea]MDR0186460.1 thioredoxin [Prevotella brunnea]
MKKILFACLVLALTLGSCSKKRNNNAPMTMQTTRANKTKEKKHMKVTEMNKAMFQEKIANLANTDKWEFKGDKPAIIDFYATWCGPCKATAPVVEEIAEEYDGQIDVYKVDVDKNEELAAWFDIRTIPTLLFIPGEGNPVTSVGAMTKPEFEKMIEQYLLKK